MKILHIANDEKWVLNQWFRVPAPDHSPLQNSLPELSCQQEQEG